MKTLGLPSAILLFVGTAWAAAPAPPSVEKWEYAELSYNARFGRAGRGHAAADDPAQAPAPAPARPSIRWTTADDEVECSSWEVLATKLKAPDAKRSEKPATNRFRVLNQLGQQGWELVSVNQQSTAMSVWVFK